MSIYSKNNKFASYLIILASLFILILVTKDQLLKIQENKDLKDSYIVELKNKKEELALINEKKAMLNNTSDDISKYEVEINENEIIDYLYSYIEETNRKNGVVLVKSINISETKTTEIGFKETNINLNLVVPSELKLKMMLDFLTSKKSKYNFFITSFNYPYGKNEGSMGVTIPLKILYK